MPCLVDCAGLLFVPGAVREVFGSGTILGLSFFGEGCKSCRNMAQLSQNAGTVNPFSRQHLFKRSRVIVAANEFLILPRVGLLDPLGNPGMLNSLLPHMDMKIDPRLVSIPARNPARHFSWLPFGKIVCMDGLDQSGK